MSIRLGDTAPDFRAETHGGPDQLPRVDRRLVGSAVLAPEGLHAGLHHRARLHGEDQARVRQAQHEDHRPLRRSGRQAREVGRRHRGDAGHAPNYPMIGDADFNVSKLYGMLGADVSGDPADRTAADNQTVRNVFVIGPDKKVKLILVYPMTTGRNFDEVLRVIDSLQLTAEHKVSTPVNWQQGEDVIIAGSVSNDEAKRDSSASGRSRSRTSGSSRNPTPSGGRHEHDLHLRHLEAERRQRGRLRRRLEAVRLLGEQHAGGRPAAARPRPPRARAVRQLRRLGEHRRGQRLEELGRVPRADGAASSSTSKSSSRPS